MLKIFKPLAHYFPYDVKLRLLAHSRSFLANQKARNAIVGAENLLNSYSLPHIDVCGQLIMMLAIRHRVAAKNKRPQKIH